MSVTIQRSIQGIITAVRALIFQLN